MRRASSRMTSAMRRSSALGGDDLRDHTMVGEMGLHLRPGHRIRRGIHDEDDRARRLLDEVQPFAQGAGRLAAAVPGDQHGLDRPLPVAAGRHEQERASAAEEHRLHQVRPDCRLGLAIGPRGDEEIGAAGLLHDLSGQGAERLVEPAQLARHLKAGQSLRQPLGGGIAVPRGPGPAARSGPASRPRRHPSAWRP